MNILFLTIISVNDIEEQSIYNDLMKTFRDFGHTVYIACPIERRYKQKTTQVTNAGINILKIKTLNFQKTNIIEKGLSTVLLEHQFFKAVKKYFHNTKFDLVLYSTPPITFTKVVNFIKERDNAFSYLMLKDIFPQNAVDLNMLKPGGVLHAYFKGKERDLYSISDRIGCMSPANMEFVRVHNKELDAGKLELCPNSIIPRTNWISDVQKVITKEKYNISKDAKVFIYGGNLGKPQGIDFLLEVLKANQNVTGMFFLIIGSGTEYIKLKRWFDAVNPKNSMLIPSLPKKEYDEILMSSDVGMIFLDKRFTIPNFPSRLLSYLECKMPILAATDLSSDIGTTAENNGFGFWCESGDIDAFNKHLNTLINQPRLIEEMGEKGYEYLNDNYTSQRSYEIIMNHLNV